ncbi:glutathione S-transferase 1-like [Anopheles ziemanni]|uniref:glutathione S-transferase 1-like n=1 Tax=Anopheles coustani TaxID=139045 RepID=UPI00265A1A7B|nr:glutathione S-transferase 1-like [Anopheles coustani]XP_058168624.1 glutathione S-transferase 1-like [Anopheles ziemanni]
MSKLVLYTNQKSPPCRAVKLTARALGVDLNEKEMTLVRGDKLMEEFRKVSPQHTIPVLDDSGTIITASHAIMIYLVCKYGKDDDSLYPNDLVHRARVHTALHLESGVIFSRLSFLFEPVIYSGKSYFHSDRVEHIRKAYRLLEDSLVDDYVVGSSLTIADFSCISSIATLVGVVPLDEEKFPKISAWMNRMKELPYYEEANGAGALELAEFVLGKKELNATQYL